MSRSAPRSIDEYLSELRAALAGEDPALMQDALYDAEEYLRAEVAASAGKPEADVLERISTTYGTPDEIAAAYRDTERKVRVALQPPAPRRAASSSLAGQFFGIYTDPRAYGSLFFMFLSLITGIVYFTFAVTGLSLSAGLSILIIGLPVFLAFILIARALSLGEGRLLEAVSGERMPRRPVHPGAAESFFDRILNMLKDPQTWTTLVYLILMLPLGIVYFTTAVTMLSLGVSFLLLPFAMVGQRWNWWLPWHDVGDMTFTPAWLDTPFGSWLDTPFGWVFCFIFGIVILTTLMHLARALVSVHAKAAKVLLVQ